MMDKQTEEITVQNNQQLIGVKITEDTIKRLIYVIREQQVMMDSDLAMLYQVETKRLNENVKRNKKRFPDNFCFQLTEGETDSLRSQFATSIGNDTIYS